MNSRDRAVMRNRDRDPVKVFAVTRFVRRKSTTGGGHAYAVELIARGTGTVMYRSKTCDTLLDAQTLAFRYLAREPGLQFDPKVM